MRYTKLIRTMTLGLALAAPTAMAKDAAVKLNCPAGTKQSGSKAEGLSCTKFDAKHGTQIAHGDYVEYHPNGVKATQGQFENGLKVGVWTFFDAAGTKWGTTEFKDGAWDGKRITYFPNGKPHLVEEYKNSRKHGLTQELSQDGQVVSQVRYDNNRLVSAQ
ncbi:toxin-antitoxin system YwqK family antitoxin [Myxococcus sp. Y35]|uniref:toxin-antitoxin system YwqK family antitoxin n=1 Tax=Pseudomyxococcus flavus TaxID=3115648 RepID=UPI003CE82F3F